MRQRGTLRDIIAACAAVLLCNASAFADILTINGSAGTVYDGVIDGFPNLAPQDGIPDFGGNALAIALKTGVTEERGIGEFPLAQLAGLTSADILSATLTFNIDDVVGTFGPGTNFDGTAADTIVLFAYAGNGTVDLADFNNVAGAPLGIVNTTPLGVITDATLATTGPLAFEVDVTAKLGSLLDAAATHMGVVFATTDNNTATSIDNLGAGGAGPPGVGGAKMPFLTVTTVSDEPPVFGKAQRACQQALALEARKYASQLHTLLNRCLDRIVKDVGSGKGTAAAVELCASSLNPTATPPSKFAKARAAALQKIGKKCAAPLTPADLNSPCILAAATFADVATCLLDDHAINVQEMIRAEYRDACAMLTAVGLDAAYPTACVSP